MRQFLTFAFFTVSLLSVAEGQTTSWSPPVSNPVLDNLNDVYFVDALKGWAVGLNGNIVNTTDGGQNWSPQYNEYTLVLRDVFFLDSLHGWALGRNNLAGYIARIFITVNGGQTWFARMTGVEDALHFISRDTGFVAGVGGTIRKSTDGGNTWTDLPRATTRKLRSLFFLNQTFGWCAGDTGTVVRTTDNGTSWSTVQVPSTSDLRSIHFASVDVGWCAGFDGTILQPLWRKNHFYQPLYSGNQAPNFFAGRYW